MQAGNLFHSNNDNKPWVLRVVALLALLSRVFLSSLVPAQQLSRIVLLSSWPLALEWGAIFGNISLLIRVLSNSFNAHLKTVLFSRAGIWSAPE